MSLKPTMRRSKMGGRKNCSGPGKTALCLTFSAVFFIALVVSRQARALPGEQPFNTLIFKASHNSFDRKESLAQQIDDYNVWQIELDLWDYRGEIKVNHSGDAASLEAADSLATLLNRIPRESHYFRSRVTVIYFDIHTISWAGWTSDSRTRLRSICYATLGEKHVYPASQFIGDDRSRWPSYQNLVRRGYNWILIADWGSLVTGSSNNDDLFFTTTHQERPYASALTNNTVLVNIDGGCDAGSARPAMPVVVRDGRDRWLTRSYPSGECSSTCLGQNGVYWKDAIAHSYNFIATNCIDWDHTFEEPTHSPDPLFVAVSRAGECPHEYASCEWGTHSFPIHNLLMALERASSGVTIEMEGGTYIVTHGGDSRAVTKPVILRGRIGQLVTIR